MRAVNDLVTRGKSAVESGDFSGGEQLFAEAKDKLPDGEDRFAAQKLAEIADSLYTASKANPGPQADEALKQSIQTARDAKKKDASNPLPYYTLGKINADLKQTDNAITELKEATRLDPKNYLYAYEKSGNADSAIAAYVQAAGLDKKYTEPRINLGRIAVRKTQGGAEHHRHLAGAGPSLFRWTSLGRAQVMAGATRVGLLLPGRELRRRCSRSNSAQERDIAPSVEADPPRSWNRLPPVSSITSGRFPGFYSGIHLLPRTGYSGLGSDPRRQACTEHSRASSRPNSGR